MCKEQRPLSIVRFLGEALVLNPIASTSTPEVNQTDNGRTSEEVSIFERIYLPILIRNGISITDHDREEMELRGLPPISESRLEAARQSEGRRRYRQWRELHLALGPVRLLLDEAMRFAEFDSYVSDPGLPTDDLGDLSFEFPDLDAVFPFPLFETWSPEPEDLLSVTPGQLQEPRDTVQTLGTDDMRFGNELRDTVQTVGSNDARFGNEGYQSLRSSISGSEMEEGELEDDERLEGERLKGEREEDEREEDKREEDKRKEDESEENKREEDKRKDVKRKKGEREEGEREKGEREEGEREKSEKEEGERDESESVGGEREDVERQEGKLE
ncbi:MAG: hypothetical protein Q9161_004112 [Pseudevernia consocians]